MKRLMALMATVAMLLAMAVGFGGAPATAAGSLVIKGNPGLEKAKATSSRALLAGPYYFYSLGRQTFPAGTTSTGAAVNLTIEKPYLDTANDSHTLAELAVHSADYQQVVEVGWTVDPIVCGSIAASPCLFVFFWVNGTPMGYNTPDFIDNGANPINAGASLAAVPVGTNKRFQITNTGTAWWIAYDGAWLGYYPNTEWTVTFDKADVIQAFHEVATKVAGDNKPCSDMGNGKFSSSGTSARFGSYALTGPNPPGTVANLAFSTQPVDNAAYTITTVTAGITARSGGPMYNAANTTPGNIGSC